MGRGERVSFSIENSDMIRINPPGPPSTLPPSPLSFFTSVLARWEPPYTGGVPAYISYRLAELLHQIYGLPNLGERLQPTDSNSDPEEKSIQPPVRNLSQELWRNRVIKPGRGWRKEKRSHTLDMCWDDTLVPYDLKRDLTTLFLKRS